MRERMAIPAMLMLCLSLLGIRAWPARAAGRIPVAGLDFELVDGSDEELRCTLRLMNGLRAGYREKDEKVAWFAASYRDRRSCRAVAGAFKLELGSGLLFGNSGRFFCSTWRRSPPRMHVRIAPSLSLWNRQVGAAFSLGVRGINSHLAVFEKPGSPAEASAPPAVLVALSSDSHALRCGVGMLALLGSGRGANGPHGTGVQFYHLFSSLVLDEVFAAGEFDLLAGKRYGLIEMGLNSRVEGGIKLFRSPDLKDIGIWDQAVKNSCDELSGMVMHAACKTVAGNPRFHVQSTVRNQDTRRLRQRACGIALSGKNGRRGRWEIDWSAREEYETEYPASLWTSALATAHTRECRVRSTLRMRDQWYEQVIHTDLMFDRLTWKPYGASAAIEMRVSRRRLTITGKIQAWSLRSGDPIALFRPGVGSFELWSLVYGQGSDLCVRATITLRSGVSLTGFYGKAREKSGKIYTAMRWKF